MFFKRLTLEQSLSQAFVLELGTWRNKDNFLEFQHMVCVLKASQGIKARFKSKIVNNIRFLLEDPGLY